MMIGEFGRTPKINNDGGRDHWGPCFTGLFAGFVKSTAANGTEAQRCQRDLSLTDRLVAISRQREQQIKQGALLQEVTRQQFIVWVTGELLDDDNRVGREVLNPRQALP